MKRGLSITGLVILAALIAAAGWFYRPWSPYSPAKVLEGRSAEDRVPFYRTMGEYFPYREIEGAGQPTRLPRTLRDVEIAYIFDDTPRSLEVYAAEHDITGLMMVKDGAVIVEEYWRGETPESLHTSWSVAKSFVATLIGMAVLDGRIDSLDDQVEKYAPIYAGTDYGSTSIRHVMMMSTGIDFNEDYEVKGSDIRKLFFNAFILHKDIDKFARGYDRARPAGEEFHYISTNSVVLGAVVSGAFDGRSLSDIASERLFKPLGMAGGEWLTDRHSAEGKELAYCCINIPLEDYAKFGLLYAQDGMVNGQRLLPEGWTGFVGSPGADSHAPGNAARAGELGYGHHFWIPEDANGAFYAAGYNGQFVWIDPVRNIVLAMTAADKTYPDENDEVRQLMQAAVDAAADLP